MMKYLIPAFALVFSGCASFRKGEAINRGELWKMMEDKSSPAASAVKVSWKQVSFYTQSELIGRDEAYIRELNREKPVKPKQAEFFRKKTGKVLSEAGIFDVESGSGTLNISLVSHGRWTYRSLMSGFLAETAYILILPNSITSGYRMTADGIIAGKRVKAEETAQIKTTFHLLMFPLYPFFRPGGQEKTLIRDMLWKISCKVYSQIKDAPAVETKSSDF
ncbi:MAG: hypothetical protein ABIG11_06880 [bacterium]